MKYQNSAKICFKEKEMFYTFLQMNNKYRTYDLYFILFCIQWDENNILILYTQIDKFIFRRIVVSPCRWVSGHQVLDSTIQYNRTANENIVSYNHINYLS